MAIGFREFPAPVQALAYVVLAVATWLGAEYIPGSPMQQVRSDVSATSSLVNNLQKEVDGLQNFERQRGQLKAEIDALQKQLDTLKTIVPDEKEVDGFILAMHDSAKASGVALRRLTAKPISPHGDYFEVPFEVEADGPYFQVVDFFTRLGQLSRVINVSEIEFASPEESKTGHRYAVRSGTTVVGKFVATTYFTGGVNAPAPQGPAKAAPAGAPGRR